MQLNCPRLFSSGLCAQLVRQQQHLLVQFRQDGDPLGRGHGSGGSQISMVRRAQKINCVQFNEEATVILSGRHTKTKSPRLRRRYTGHTMKGYKLECCLSCKDTHVLSCSEDGHVYFWDLVEVNGKTIARSERMYATGLTLASGHASEKRSNAKRLAVIEASCGQGGGQVVLPSNAAASPHRQRRLRPSVGGLAGRSRRKRRRRRDIAPAYVWTFSLLLQQTTLSHRDRFVRMASY
nr:uncharacterized protein LOC125991005 isoform X1 [Syngnathus scovelli]